MCRSVSNFATTIINTIITVMVKNTRVYIYRYKKLVYITLFDMYAFICYLSHRAVDETSSLRYRRIRGREIQTMDRTVTGMIIIIISHIFSLLSTQRRGKSTRFSLRGLENIGEITGAKYSRVEISLSPLPQSSLDYDRPLCDRNLISSPRARGGRERKSIYRTGITGHIDASCTFHGEPPRMHDSPPPQSGLFMACLFALRLRGKRLFCTFLPSPSFSFLLPRN